MTGIQKALGEWILKGMLATFPRPPSLLQSFPRRPFSFQLQEAETAGKQGLEYWSHAFEECWRFNWKSIMGKGRTVTKATTAAAPTSQAGPLFSLIHCSPRGDTQTGVKHLMENWDLERPDKVRSGPALEGQSAPPTMLAGQCRLRAGCLNWSREGIFPCGPKLALADTGFLPSLHCLPFQHRTSLHISLSLGELQGRPQSRP
ncbi:uncharacterized protein LOC125440302 [Sphaerodactylus townsendi]|uniref:uncharacterized protein LOC125440302 n=1 Tax=Sphaerodactylus townsendi TaxID=933632 RepID=UPI0020264984|nr:uncharacterized protein LOC125440302 [Sphaerodactylus townsendi]